MLRLFYSKSDECKDIEENFDVESKMYTTQENSNFNVFCKF